MDTVLFNIKKPHNNRAQILMLLPQDINQFETHRPANPAAKQPSYLFEQIFKECEQVKSVVLHAAMNDSITKLFQMVLQNQSQDSPQQTAKIYPIILRENQQPDLPVYVGKILSRLYEIEGTKLSIFGHPCDEVLIKEKEGTDVREILLNIYEDFTQFQAKPEFKFYVYVIKDATDLSEDNLYIFSKGITNKNFIAFIPTLQTFSEQNYEAMSKLQIQKFITNLYDSRQTFSKYIYNCIKNLKIKAYMPPQILNLVTDMSFYHLSYAENCRRFNYCLLKALQLNPSQRREIAIDKEIQQIETIIKNKFKYRDYATSWYNILRVILVEQQTYKISHSALSVQVSLSNGYSIYRSEKAQQHRRYEDDFIQNVAKSYRKHLDKNSLAIFQLLEPKERSLSTRLRRMDRVQKLGLGNKKKNVTPKMQLQNNITRIIKSLTKEVRKHGKTINWSAIKFIERIKPPIPLKIVEAMRKEDAQSVEVVEQITSNHSKPLSSMLSLFGEDSIGYGLYLIKTLELSGLFSLSKKEINPFVYNNFYQKTKFN